MKITQEQQTKGKEFFQELVTKAWNDPSFKNELIESPVATIEKVTGQKLTLANNTTVVVDDQTDPSTIYLNIPRKIDVDDFELSDEQLEVIAGGEVVGTAAAVAGVCLLAGAIGVGVGYLMAK